MHISEYTNRYTALWADRIGVASAVLLSGLLMASGTAAAEYYAYDAAGRLTRVVYDDGTYVAYGYDGAANIVSKQLSSTAAPEYTLTVALDGAGAVTSSTAAIDCGTDCTETMTEGLSLTLDAWPDSGWVFTGWSGGGCSGTGGCTVAVNADTAVTATFGQSAVLTVTLAGEGTGSVTSDPVGIDCGTDCTEPFVDGDSVALTALADAGSEFAGWSGGQCGTATSCTIAMNSDATVTATFDLATGGGDSTADDSTADDSTTDDSTTDGSSTGDEPPADNSSNGGGGGGGAAGGLFLLLLLSTRLLLRRGR